MGPEEILLSNLCAMMLNVHSLLHAHTNKIQNMQIPRIDIGTDVWGESNIMADVY